MNFNAATGRDPAGNIQLPSHQDHYGDTQPSGSPTFNPGAYQQTTVSSVDSSHHGTGNGHVKKPQQLPLPPSSSSSSSSPHLVLRHDDGSLNQQHLPQTVYADLHRGTLTPATPSTKISPSFPGLSPRTAQNPPTPSFVPDDRSLPARAVADDTLDGAYCAFILYCNPVFPLSVDLSELKRGFRAPPRSDGKAFSTWNLFGLIRKFDQKEIKTWQQLALELGVEPPSLDKGQSTQKVQQYSVRLKRWMRAMHIDAFFEYLLGKQHPYYLRIPSLQAPFPETGRDGVPLEEDLALRALDPKFRPKRGRRKAEDVDDDQDRASTPDPKRPHLDTSIEFGSPHAFAHPQSAYPQSAIPMSGRSDDMDRFVNAHDPWTTPTVPHAVSQAIMGPSLGKLLTPSSTMTPSASQQLNWRLHGQDNTPATPHPMSAITPMTAQIPDSGFDEPRSAITPFSSKPRSRRRHGPAVSSAWSSGGGGTAGGKLRGRPPANRSVRDGPFVTFPANPKGRERPGVDLYRSTPASTPVADRPPSESMEANRHFQFPPDPPQRSDTTPTTQIRPERLQLRVPQHVGGPVHLVTPTVLVNGQADAGGPNISSQTDLVPARMSGYFFDECGGGGGGGGGGTDEPAEHEPDQSFNATQSSAHRSERDQHAQQPYGPTLAFELGDLKRALTADLLRATVVGRKRLRGFEAKHLADAMIKRLRSRPEPSDGAAETVFRINCASWLGLSHAVGTSGGSVGSGKRILVQRYRVEEDGYEVPVEEEDEPLEAGGEGAKETCDVSWSLLLGGLSGDFQIKGIDLPRAGRRVDGVGEDGMDEGQGHAHAHALANDGSGANSAMDWQRRVLALQEKLRLKEVEVQRLTDRVLEAVL